MGVLVGFLGGGVVMWGGAFGWCLVVFERGIWVVFGHFKGAFGWCYLEYQTDFLGYSVAFLGRMGVLTWMAGWRLLADPFVLQGLWYVFLLGEICWSFCAVTRNRGRC